MHYKQKNTLWGVLGFSWSGRQDSNLRPSAPKADALPNCATSRFLLGAPDMSRTRNLQIRSLTLYPIELRAQVISRRISPFGGSYRNRTDGD